MHYKPISLTLWWVLLVKSISAASVEELTYWIGPECDGKGFNEAVMNEVRDMGTEGSKRVGDGNDEIMAHAFKTVFKVEKSDENALSQVTKAFDTIAKLKQTDDKKASDVRIYCDNDDAGQQGNRWQLKPGKKNRKAPFEDQTWWDEQDAIYRPKGSKGCQSEDDEGRTDGTLAQTYKTKDLPQYDMLPDHNPNRETFTICDAGLEFGDGDYKLLGDFKEDDAKIVQLPVTDFDALLSLTVFHEFCHITRVLDLPGDRPDPNDPDNRITEVTEWENVLKLDAETAIITPDAFAWLGMLAIMEKRNLRLARKDSEDEEEKKRADLEHGGGLVWVDKEKAPKPNSKRTLVKPRGFVAPNHLVPSATPRIRGRLVAGLAA
ncbi:hypothetical protein BCR34DRAFT_551927 [Clohesyomyces aquaticus]|uniref:Lysine-specific metallo-endopeptidase domain-containing protein n=1 Tax=Clohesyomyces aquaticus TaxID=1231657 RepID=A0A1Y2AAR2_9PLEO|nr:hypothetical protein BCR34DRAFT_551927 [Clohesyomyces aquaticus]